MIRLEPLTLAEAPFILRLLNTPGFLEHIGDKGVRTLGDAEAYLLKGPLASYATHGHGLLCVRRTDSGEPIGMAGLVRREGLPGPDLGYAFLPEQGGRGYAREAARQVLGDAWDRLHLPRVLAVVKPGNDRSIHLLTALGFQDRGWVRLYPDEPEDRCFEVERPLR
jgi:RimJ/RimL family protein N-acetyltransferase